MIKSCLRCKTKFSFDPIQEGCKRRVCNACIEKRTRLHNNKPYRTKEQARNNQLKYKYGITSEQYDEIKNAQKGVCAICRLDANGRWGNVLHVDHSHDTGRVRGLLCERCNSGLGYFKDHPGFLQVAVTYLLSYEKGLRNDTQN